MIPLHGGHYGLFCLDDELHTLEDAQYTHVFKCLKRKPSYAVVEWLGVDGSTTEEIDIRRCLEVYTPKTHPELYL